MPVNNDNLKEVINWFRRIDFHLSLRQQNSMNQEELLIGDKLQRLIED